MLLSKANLYPETDQMTSFYARAFTHPARLQIMRMLRNQGQMTVQQLASDHPLTPAAFSQHLELLRDIQIIRFQPQYPYLLYSLDEERYKEACDCLIQYLMDV